MNKEMQVGPFKVVSCDWWPDGRWELVNEDAAQKIKAIDEKAEILKRLVKAGKISRLVVE